MRHDNDNKETGAHCNDVASALAAGPRLLFETYESPLKCTLNAINVIITMVMMMMSLITSRVVGKCEK